MSVWAYVSGRLAKWLFYQRILPGFGLFLALNWYVPDAFDGKKPDLSRTPIILPRSKLRTGSSEQFEENIPLGNTLNYCGGLLWRPTISMG